MKRISLIFWAAAITIIALSIAVLPARSATLSVTVPDGTCPTLTGYEVTCKATGVTPPPSPPPGPPPAPGGGYNACLLQGLTVRQVELKYPIGANYRIDTGIGGPVFGNTDALIVHFKTPAADTSGGAQFSIVARGGAPNVVRVAALSTSPCVFPTGFSTDLPASTRSQGPTFHVTLTPKPSFTVLQPNTDYYITVTNRNDFAGPPSCTAADCPVFIDAN